MCGVVGFSGKATEDDRLAFFLLCGESCVRGLHAFGIAYYTEGSGLSVVKGVSFREVMQAIPNPLPSKIVFHNRYCTSGNHRDNRNNQPICIGGDALVFNGTVDMGTQQEMAERYGYDLLTENDGEIVLRDCLEDKPWAHLTNGQTFAGIILRQNGTMLALRNKNRPLWRVCGEGGTFITSTKDIAIRARFAPSNCHPIEPYTINEL